MHIPNYSIHVASPLAGWRASATVATRTFLIELQLHAPLAGWRTGALASTRSDTYSLASYRMRVATRSYT